MEGSKRMRAVLDRRSFLRLGAAGGALAAVGGMATTQGWLAPAQATAAPEERTAFTYHNEHCLCNCMLQCTVRDGRLVMVQPRPNSDKRFQNVCLRAFPRSSTSMAKRAFNRLCVAWENAAAVSSR